MSARPRVFVSSVIDGFEEYRQAAARAIEASGGEPVLVNEQFPSVTTSSRNACLDAIESCDYFVLVVGERGGWRTPSGRLVVEEEWEHALGRKLPVLVFLQNGIQDADAKQLARRVSDYVDGFFRATFIDADQLADEIERALRPLLRNPMNPNNNSDPVAEYLVRPHRFHDQTSLRVAVAPERFEEVFEPVQLASDDFGERVMEIGHAREVRLFGYQFAKDEPRLEGAWFRVDQPLGNDWRNGRQGVHLAISEGGVVLVDTNVTGRVERNNSASMVDVMTIAIETVEAMIETSLRFVAALYDDHDRYKRHQRFYWNAALTGIGYRTFARSPQEQRSYLMNMSGDEAAMPAFERSRLITRSDLTQPRKEIERAILYWTRQRGRRH